MNWETALTFLKIEYGNIASVVGLMLTLLAIWNIQRVRRATARAVARALDRVQA